MPIKKSSSKKELTAFLEKNQEEDEEWSLAQHSVEDESIAAESSTGHQRLDQEGGLFSPKKPKKLKSTEKKKKTKSSSSSSVGGLSKDGSVKKKKTKKEGKLSDDSSSSLHYMPTQASSRTLNDTDDDISMVSAKSTRSTRSTKSTKSSTPKKKKKVKDEDDADDGTSVSSKKSRKGSSKESSKRRARSTDKTLSLEEQQQQQVASALYSGHGRNGKKEDDDMDWQAENKALQAEIAFLSRQLNEAMQLLDEAKSPETRYQDTTQLQAELKRYKNEISELKAEVDEYEEAVTEKDGLIKKLTEAVDSQLDKVEYLELKLQRAEEEFCKMEDEMKDMEDEMESLKTDTGHQSVVSSSRSQTQGVAPAGDEPLLRSSAHSTGSAGSLRLVADDMQRRLIEDKLKRLEQRESEVQEREVEMYDREQDLLDREEDLANREKEVMLRAEADLGAEMDQMRIKELRLQERERELANSDDQRRIRELRLQEQKRELSEMEERLEAMKAAYEERELELERKIQAHEDQVREQVDKDLERSLGTVDVNEKDISMASTAVTGEISDLKAQIEELYRQKEKMEVSLAGKQEEADETNDVVSELKESVKNYQIEVAELRDANETLLKMQTNQKQARETQHDLVIQSIHEGNKKQIQELYEENRKLQAELIVLKEQNAVLKDSIPDEGVDLKDFAMTGLQDEIADLREKIVGKEREAKGLREQIDKLKSDIEENGTEMKEMESEARSLANQLKETKASITKKMKQKDETISFMQNEMIRIMKEKSVVDKKLAEKERLLKEPESLRKHSKDVVTPRDEEAEMAKVQAFNDQLAALDAENRELQEKLEHARIDHEMQLKSKEAKILEIEDELADLNWEMKARKEADYVSLLKDRKERKKELETTKKNMKKAEESIADLEFQLEQSKRNHQDLEKDVEELNKSLMARDSGDYVSGLKRQIRSLKEHNMALERNIEIEASNSAYVVETKDEKIKELELQIRDLKNPAQAAVRGMLAFATRGNTSRSTRSIDNVIFDEQSDAANTDAPPSVVKTEDKKEFENSPKPAVSLRPPSTPSRKPSLWSAIISPFGSKRNLDLAPVEDREEKKSIRGAPIEEGDNEHTEADSVENELQTVEKEAGGGNGDAEANNVGDHEHTFSTKDSDGHTQETNVEATEMQQMGMDKAVEMIPINDPDERAHTDAAEMVPTDELGDRVEEKSSAGDESLETADDIDTDDDVNLIPSDIDDDEDDATMEDNLDSDQNGKGVSASSKENVVFV